MVHTKDKSLVTEDIYIRGKELMVYMKIEHHIVKEDIFSINCEVCL